MRWRSVPVSCRPASSSSGTLGGGGGGGAPSRFSSTNFPRLTGRCTCRIRGHRKHTCLREHSRAGRTLQRHALEFRARHAGDPVVLRQRFVQESEIRVQDPQQTQVFPHNGPKETRCFLAHGGQQLAIAARELLRIEHHVIQAAQLQPLAGEILDERLSLRVRAASGAPAAPTGLLPQLVPRQPAQTTPRPACCSRGNTTSASPVRIR